MIDLSNKIFLFDQFHQESSEKVISGIVDRFEKGEKDIEIYINSYGGNVTDLYAIIDTIDKYRNDGLKVTTVAMGAAMSAGALLLMYGDDRFIAKNAEVLTHGVQAWAIGSEKEIKEVVERMKQINSRFADIISSKTGMTAEEAKELLKEDRTYTAEEAVKYGFVDSVYGSEDKLEEIEDYIQELAADARKDGKVKDAMKFIASVRKQKPQKKDNNMAEKEKIELELKAANKLVSDYKAKFEDLKSENADLKAKLKDVDKYKAEFFDKQKDNLIAKSKKLVSKDEKEQDRFEAELKEFKELPYEKFEKLTNQMLSTRVNSVETGVVIDSTDVDKKKAENKGKTQAEIDIAEFNAKNKSVDLSYAKKTMGGK